MVKVAPDEAAVYLTALVRNEHQPGSTRLEAVMVASKHVTLKQLVDLYEVLVRSTSMTAENRLVAAEKAMAVDRTAGKDMVASFAKDRRIDVKFRMSAAAALGRAKFSQAEFEAYASISDDPNVPGLNRVFAAKKAQRAKMFAGGHVLRKLVHAGLDGEARLALARALDQRDAVLVLEKLVDDPNEGSTLRMEAAKYLMRLDAKAGKRAMGRLAEDTKLSSSLRNQARMAAR